MKLEIRLDSDRVAAGEKISGRLDVLEGGPSRSLTLTIGFHERSPSYEFIPFSDSSVVHEGDLHAGETVDFDYLMPDSALPSVKSEHGELYWEIEATSDEPGFDTQIRRRIEIVSRA